MAGEKGQSQGSAPLSRPKFKKAPTIWVGGILTSNATTKIVFSSTVKWNYIPGGSYSFHGSVTPSKAVVVVVVVVDVVLLVVVVVVAVMDELLVVFSASSIREDQL